MTSPRSARMSPVRTSLALAASAALLAACAGGDEQAAPEETSTASQAEIEGGVTYEPGLASCQFNNELEDFEGDGTGVSPYGELDRAELREEDDAYVVTLTGDFFDPEVLLDEDANGDVQVMLHGEDFMEAAPNLVTAFGYGNFGFSGTTLEGERYEQDTGAVIEDGVFTATHPKDSPHFKGFEPVQWTVAVGFNDGNDATNPVSFRCGDGRAWTWEPAA